MIVLRIAKPPCRSTADPGGMRTDGRPVASTGRQPAPPWLRATFGAILLIGILVGWSIEGVVAGAQDAPLNQPTTLAPRTIPDFADLVAHVKPAVVSITSRLQVSREEADQETQRGQTLPFPFNQFPFNQMIPRPRAVEARGSGFIIKPDGTIITNNHVVENAISVMVTLDDGSQLSARIAGRDPRTDIAVLKVTAARPLAYLELGDSSAVRAGEWVVAMGNPFGLGGTATVGIVSAQSRDIGAGPYDQFIQVDAPINQGNSGGPLFTQDGKVIGMTTAILSPSGGSVGIGFAVPSNVIRMIAPQLETAGHIVRGFIGVQTQSISQALAKALRLNDRAGALVAGVEPDGPAARAGVEVGDVVRAVNGQPVTTPRDLAVAVASIQPGSQARLVIVRSGREQSVTVTVAALPEQAVEASAAARQPQEAGLGLALGPLSSALRRQLDLPEATNGAVVIKVQPGSPADDAGILAGDVIVGVGTTAVNDPREATRAIRQAQQGEGHAVLLRIFRDGRPVFVAIDLAPSGKG
jgi:serine protease Do